MVLPLPVRRRGLLVAAPVVLILAAVMIWFVLSSRMEAASSATDYWTGEYFGFLPSQGLDPRMGTTSQTRPVLTRNDDEIAFDWSKGAPAAGLPTDRFTVRWNRTARFDTGVYRFHAKADDGVRLYIDDQMQIDRWSDNRGADQVVDIPLEKGDHKVRVEYYENWGEASIKVWWEPIPEASVGVKEVAGSQPADPPTISSGATVAQAAALPTAAAQNGKSGAPTPAGNLLVNGSFETSASGSDLPAEWKVSIPDSGVTLANNVPGAKSGSVLSIKPNQKSYIMTQEVQAKAGEAYDFSGSVNIPSAEGWFRLTITLIPLNDKNEPLATYDQATFTKATEGWSEMKSRITAPSYTTRIRAQIKVDVMRAPAFIDDLQLKLAGS